MELSGTDVLSKALDLIQAGPLSGSNCADFCPWCAIARAKTELDILFRTELSPIQAAIYFYDELPRDRPLVKARQALKKFNSEDIAGIDQDRAIFILEDAITLEAG